MMLTVTYTKHRNKVCVCVGIPEFLSRFCKRGGKPGFVEFGGQTMAKEGKCNKVLHKYDLQEGANHGQGGGKCYRSF